MFWQHRASRTNRGSKELVKKLQLMKFPLSLIRACGHKVLSSIFRKNVSAKMKFCAGKSGEGAAKPRLFAL